jgi:hypothetical protein
MSHPAVFACSVLASGFLLGGCAASRSADPPVSERSWFGFGAPVDPPPTALTQYARELDARAGAAGYLLTPLGARTDGDLLIIDLGARVPPGMAPYYVQKYGELLADAPGRTIRVTTPAGVEPAYRRRKVESAPPDTHINRAELPVRTVSGSAAHADLVLTTFVCAADDFPPGEYELRLTGYAGLPEGSILRSLKDAGITIDEKPRRVRVK